MAGAGKQRMLRATMRVAVPAVLLGLAIWIDFEARRIEALVASPYPITSSLRYDRVLVDSPMWAARHRQRLVGSDLPVEFAFRPGETLGEVLSGLSLSPGEAQAVIVELSRYVDVRKLRPVDRYAALVDANSELRGIRLALAGKGRAEVTRSGQDWTAAWHPVVQSVETRLIKGLLDGALESSIRQAGGEMSLAYEMAEVLQWDLDFNRDLRIGDRFEVLYERIFHDGELHGVGRILALAYDNAGRRLEAYLFGDEEDYYDADGRPLRKLFLRSPLRYSRITSGFSGRRFHPILKQNLPHYGVDYGAPVGTPVRVTANGVITFAGWNKGGGKTIKVRHPNRYLTAYLHLSRFASGLGPGSRVRQGEVIGYVGSTGLSTSPHLDYRVQRDNRWINPQSLKSQPAEPITQERLSEFFAVRDRFRQTLAAPPGGAEGSSSEVRIVSTLEPSPAQVSDNLEK